jgi:hypothetical protein
VLAIDRDRFASEVFEIDAVALSGKTKLNSVMNQALTPHPTPYPDFVQKLDCAMLQDTCANAVLAVLAAPALHYDRFDPCAAQQLGKHKAGRAGSYDAHLRAGHSHNFPTLRLNIGMTHSAQLLDYFFRDGLALNLVGICRRAPGPHPGLETFDG